MVRKLETGEHLTERDRSAEPVNRLRPIDHKAEIRHEDNKRALFRKT